MQLAQQIKMRQSQSLVMTPQLQQAIKLLQMTNLELCQYLENQQSENPFIEVDNNTTSNENNSVVELVLLLVSLVGFRIVIRIPIRNTIGIFQFFCFITNFLI